MSVYKFFYFDIPARGEVARWLFALAQQSFEDVRIQKGEEWEQMKPRTPFGQLPMLEVDGVTVCQSSAINNFLATRFGYAGKNDVERLRVDMVVGCIEDMVMQMVRPILYAPTQEVKAVLRKGVQKRIDDFYVKMEALLVSNNGGDSYFVGDSLTLADILFCARSAFPYNADLRVPWNKLPKLLALKQRVLNEPRIQAWRQQHPEAPMYRLTYFDTAGRGEMSRLLLTVAGQAFKDIRLNKEEWADVKPNTPFGQLPILDVDDMTLCQSTAINRYIARTFGLSGKTDEESAAADMIVYTVEDLFTKIAAWYMCKDEDKKAQLLNDMKETSVPAFLRSTEALAQQNNHEGFLVGAGMTWADVVLFYTFVLLEQCGMTCSGYPALDAVTERVKNLPSVREYNEAKKQ